MGMESFTIEMKVDVKRLMGKSGRMIYLMSWGENVDTCGKTCRNELYLKFHDTSGDFNFGWGWGSKMTSIEWGFPSGFNGDLATNAWWTKSWAYYANNPATCQNSLN